MRQFSTLFCHVCLRADLEYTHTDRCTHAPDLHIHTHILVWPVLYRIGAHGIAHQMSSLACRRAQARVTDAQPAVRLSSSCSAI
mmetsp:Transcript_14720/g.42365  ORF Transcript_14720/g.42365 Transcript_14720/m.42365 type:complete len:84 (+) Transcript_14720:99-350(+)